MLILSIDTSTLVSSVAVAGEDKLLAELTTQTRLTHSETLLPHIAEVLKLAGVAKDQLDAVAVSIGPGSFTGLRIGLATAKAMCYALNIPLLAVPTLEVLAARFPVSETKICALLDAQKGNAYRAVYEWQNGLLHCRKELAVLAVDDILAECAAANEPIILTGDIVQKKAAAWQLPPLVTIAPPALIMPRAAEVAFLGLQRLQAGQTDNLMDLEPLYIRRSEAEVLWEARQKKVAEQ